MPAPYASIAPGQARGRRARRDHRARRLAGRVRGDPLIAPDRGISNILFYWARVRRPAARPPRRCTPRPGDLAHALAAHPPRFARPGRRAPGGLRHGHAGRRRPRHRPRPLQPRHAPARHRAGGRRPPLRGRAHGPHPRVRPRRRRPRRVPRLVGQHQPGRRAGPAGPGVRPRPRPDRPLLHRLHRPRRRHPRRPPADRPGQPRPRPARLGRDHHPGRPAVQQPQRRRARLRPRRPALPGPRRRRQRRRPRKQRAQNGQELLGKVLRLDVSGDGPGYAIPADNPFVDDPAVRDEIWAHRPAQPVVLRLRPRHRRPLHRRRGPEPVRGGQRGSRPARWGPQPTAGTSWRAFHCYDPPQDCDQTGLTLPVHEYAHGGGGGFRCSISGGFVHRGGTVPALAGRYLFADFCSNQIWSLDWTARTAWAR